MSTLLETCLETIVANIHQYKSLEVLPEELVTILFEVGWDGAGRRSPWGDGVHIFALHLRRPALVRPLAH